MASSPYAVTTSTDGIECHSDALRTRPKRAIRRAYTITFDNGSAGALDTSDDIIITFPEGTTIGSDVARVAANATYPILVQTDTVTSVSVSGLEVTLSVPAAISASTADITVSFARGSNMILNPTTTGSNKSLALQTTPEPDPVSSAAYTITSTATTLSSPTVVVSPASVADTAAYTITFNTGSNGKLLVGDSLKVTFPTGTTMPGSAILASDVRVNGTALTADPHVDGLSVTMATPGGHRYVGICGNCLPCQRGYSESGVGWILHHRCMVGNRTDDDHICAVCHR